MKSICYLHPPGIVCSLGDNLSEVERQLFALQPKTLVPSDEFTPGAYSPIGRVSNNIPALESLPGRDRSRNNQLLLAALAQIQDQVDELKQDFPAHRIGVILGTSTSGIAETEQAIAVKNDSGELPEDFYYQQQEIGSPAQFLSRYLELAGPATTISTACSSGAKSLAAARRMLALGLCDAVICGGVDSLCRLTLNGFSSLDQVSRNPCMPFSKDRNGINIGEAACLFVLSHKPSTVSLSGVGESSDAHHFSAPHPEGEGAERAMRQALKDAKLQAMQIDYINLHGTATVQNDKMESLAVNKVFGSETFCSSTKPLVGHTLGAAGAVEACFAWLVLQNNGKLPIQWSRDGRAIDDELIDPELAAINLVRANQSLGRDALHVLSNSFAFGGNNIALILSAKLATKLSIKNSAAR